MNELETRCLDVFPQWIRTLGQDVTALAQLLSADSLPEAAKRYVAGGINYVFKSLDLIPDGIEDLGYLDDAFVVRVASRLALEDAPAAKDADLGGHLTRLSAESGLIADLLGKDTARLERYVRGLTKGAARGRSVDEILKDAALRSAFVSEVHGWAKSYTAPGFNRDEKNLIKLKSFLSAKLPE
jgi:uncharacterized membrane protein YkvA (DUF1232 family)